MWLLSALVCALLHGCGPGEPAAPESRPTPARVVSLAPNATETIFALGQGGLLVGVSDFCDYPPEALELPKVGGHLDPNLEQILVLRPEMLFIQGQHQKVAEFAAQYQIPLVRVDMDSIESIAEGIMAIGRALDRVEEAEALCAAMHAELDEVRAAVAGCPRLRTLVITTRFEHSLDNLYTVGGPSFVSELVEAAGGGNMYGSARQPYIEASKEDVLVRAPEVIIEFHAGERLSAEDAEEFRADWERLPSLPAVQQGRIYFVHESHALRPGPRVGSTARLIARLLHPDVDLPEP